MQSAYIPSFELVNYFPFVRGEVWEVEVDDAQKIVFVILEFIHLGNSVPKACVLSVGLSKTYPPGFAEVHWCVIATLVLEIN